MLKVQNSKLYDLEERTYRFAKRCREFTKQLPRNVHNMEYSKQLVRSSGSTAANYIEANESVSKRDFSLRIKFCRKEAKESNLWIKLCDVGINQKLQKEQIELSQEAMELTKIFGTIIERSK